MIRFIRTAAEFAAAFTPLALLCAALKLWGA
jgi:hypothetical protein